MNKFVPWTSTLEFYTRMSEVQVFYLIRSADIQGGGKERCSRDQQLA